eukprot:Blabericola_migrator_1__12001@NODE_736_length_6689_cov_224_169888_g529_i0_p2_GENE_NODE_736_length_6689_cov_224_169888_g529_i0NODE_736_length_6689_cov_224_169888_g529_i0_p2_ORF_typecomplete_len424_score67_48SPT2/PF08243_11/1_8e09SPT2/PF08243_11/1_8e04_NODE_736_length_6689_cov_224_169888_g529_i050016272
MQSLAVMSAPLGRTSSTSGEAFRIPKRSVPTKTPPAIPTKQERPPVAKTTATTQDAKRRKLNSGGAFAPVPSAPRPPPKPVAPSAPPSNPVKKRPLDPAPPVSTKPRPSAPPKLARTVAPVPKAPPKPAPIPGGSVKPRPVAAAPAPRVPKAVIPATRTVGSVPQPPPKRFSIPSSTVPPARPSVKVAPPSRPLARPTVAARGVVTPGVVKRPINGGIAVPSSSTVKSKVSSIPVKAKAVPKPKAAPKAPIPRPVLKGGVPQPRPRFQIPQLGRGGCGGGGGVPIVGRPMMGRGVPQRPRPGGGFFGGPRRYPPNYDPYGLDEPTEEDLDFIDDTLEDDEDDSWRQAVRKVTGYDPSKFAERDLEEALETDAHLQSKEELLSSLIARQEDAEELKRIQAEQDEEDDEEDDDEEDEEDDADEAT